MLRRLKAVVFDLDGLMFNTEEMWFDVGTELLRRRGKTFTRELANQMMGRPGRVANQILIDTHGLHENVQKIQAEGDEILFALIEGRLAPMPGLNELLNALETAEIPKAIATSSSLAFVKRALAPFGYEPRFSFILTSEDVVDGKPHPEIYLKAADKHHVLPEEMMVLEDSANGCRAAVAAGAVAVAAPGPHSHSHEFDGAALVADTLADRRIYEMLGLSE